MGAEAGLPACAREVARVREKTHGTQILIELVNVLMELVLRNNSG
jgi:hypothetical protein